MYQKQKSRGLKLIDIPVYESLIGSINRALRDVEKGRYKIRDLALVSILTYTGTRISEAISITWNDVDSKNRTIKILQLKKRDKFTRVIPVPSLRFWQIMSKYRSWVLKNKPNVSRLFPISSRQARNIIYKFTQRYMKKRYRPHSIRHSYAIFIMKKTRDLEVVRRLLGHSSYQWLREYLNYTQEDLEDIIQEAFKSIE